jgi:hypothetical protein
MTAVRAEAALGDDIEVELSLLGSQFSQVPAEQAVSANLL